MRKHLLNCEPKQKHDEEQAFHEGIDEAVADLFHEFDLNQDALDSSAWRTLCHLLNPKYKPGSRDKIRDMVWEMEREWRRDRIVTEDRLTESDVEVYNLDWDDAERGCSEESEESEEESEEDYEDYEEDWEEEQEGELGESNTRVAA